MSQSYRSDTLNSAFRNPTVLAMIGSGFMHGLFVIFSALNPAESKPTPLQIVNIAPGTPINGNSSTGFGTAPGFGSTLMVPNGLPPINSGDIPGLSPLQDLPKISALPPQSTYMGSNPLDIFGKLKTTNPPQQSTEGARGFGSSGLGAGRSPSYSTVSPNVFSRSGSTPFGRTPQQYQNYGSGSVPGLPNVAAGTPQFGVASGSNPQTAMLPTPSPTNNIPAGILPAGITPRPQGDISPNERGTFKQWRERVLGSTASAGSIQNGPPVTVTYIPDPSDPNPIQSTARIAVIYTPEGTIQATTVVRGADTIALTNEAIKAVEAQPVKGTGGSQTITYEVTLVPERRNSLPSSSPEASPTSTSGESASPKPSAKPKKSSPASKKMPPPTPSQPATTAAPLKAPPLEPASTPPPEVSPSPSPRASIPLERPSTAEAPSVPETPKLEPLPSPSIAVPDAEASPTAP